MESSNCENESSKVVNDVDHFFKISKKRGE